MFLFAQSGSPTTSASSWVHLYPLRNSVWRDAAVFEGGAGRWMWSRRWDAGRKERVEKGWTRSIKPLTAVRSYLTVRRDLTKLVLQVHGVGVGGRCCLLAQSMVRGEVYLVKSQLLFNTSKIKKKPLPPQGVFVCVHTRTLARTHLPKSWMFSHDCDKRPASPTKSPSVLSPATWGSLTFS